MVSYKILNQTNECFDPDRVSRMHLLYAGGYEILRSARTFLPKLAIESDPSYRERLQCSSYIPYLSQFVDFFASSLFSAEISVVEAADASDSKTLGSSTSDENFYKLFAADCDLAGNSIHNFMLDTFAEALHEPQAFVGVDFRLPDLDREPTNLLEEESMGLSRAYLYDIDPLSVIDWKRNPDTGRFDWIKLRNERRIQPDPLAAPMKVVEFKVWTLDQVAVWKLFRSAPMALNKSPKPTDDVPLAAEGRTSFAEIPIFELTLPPGLALGEKLGPVCEEYYQRRSFLINNQNKACIAVPVLQLGPEIAPSGEMVSDVQSNPGRGDNVARTANSKGVLVIGRDDQFSIQESTGTAHGLLDKQLQDLVEQMTQIVHQMSNSAKQSSKALGRSAASKAQDRHATEILLSAYARYVKDFIKRVYTCISTARSESVVWVVNGLSTFVEDDREQIIKEATAIQLIPIDSPTWQKKYRTKIALSLLGTVSPEEERTIADEIGKAIDAGDHVLQTERDLMAAADSEPDEVSSPSQDNKPADAA